MTNHNNERIARNTLALYIRMAFVMGVTLFTSRIVLNELGVEDYGLYNVIGGIIVLLSFLNGAMGVTIQRFLSYEMGSGDHEILRITFTQTIIVNVVIALLILVIAETIGLWFVLNKLVIPPGQETAAFWVYQISIATFLISVLQSPFNAAIISNEKMSIYAYFSIIEVIGKLIVAYSLTLFNKDRVIWYAGMYFTISLTIIVCYVIYCTIKFKECRLIRKIEINIIKKLTGFAGWSLFGSIAWAAKGQGLNVLLNLFFGTTVNAAYGIANQVNAAINSFVQNFSLAIAPQIVKTYSTNDYKQSINLIYYGSKFSFLLLLIVAYPIFICVEPILDLWLVEVPHYSASFIRLIIIISLLESFTYPIGTAIQATGKIRIYQTVIGLTLLLTLPISWIFLKYGYQASIVFYISIIISLIALALRLIILKQNLYIFSIRNYIIQVLLPSSIVFFFCAISFLINLRIMEIHPVPFVIDLIGTFLLGLFYSITIGINKHEKKKIYRMVLSKLNINSTQSK